MKKIILAAALILSASFVSYTKNSNTKITTLTLNNAKTLTDEHSKLEVGFSHSERLDIGQADGESN